MIECRGLLIHGVHFESLEVEEEADLFTEHIRSQYSRFILEQIKGAEIVTIIESVLFQDIISMAVHMGMNQNKLIELTSTLQQIIAPLETLLIYFYQINVEGQWRFICNVRGNEWGPVSLHTDDDFNEAAILWTRSQTFVRSIADTWDIPKLIIENKEYLWHEYSKLITDFIHSYVRQ